MDTDPDKITPTDTPAVADTPVADPPPVADGPMAAMDAGIAAAAEAPAPEPAAEPEPEGDEPAPEPEPEADPPPEVDPVDTEIAELKLGERSAERFRELSKSEKALAPIREAAEKAGVTLDDLPVVFERARERDDFVRMVSETGATPEQFGKLLDYQTTITAANKGDLAAAEAAFTMLLPEVQTLAKLLGKDIAGIADPLADHPDLKDDVENGDITKERALELARSRTQDLLQKTTREQTTQIEQAAQEKTQAVDWLNRFDAHMEGSDPTYAAKRPVLLAFVETIGSTLPPAKWPEAVKAYYARIPSPVAAPAPKPRPGPVRTHIPPARMEPAVYDNPMAALDAGIAAASGR